MLLKKSANSVLTSKVFTNTSGISGRDKIIARPKLHQHHSTRSKYIWLGVEIGTKFHQHHSIISKYIWLGVEIGTKFLIFFLLQFEFL